MDVTFEVENQKFNYRVCGIIIDNQKILAMRDECSPYYYLPGGRVKLGETAEESIQREMLEELQISPKIIRPLWLDQSFFTEDVNQKHYHELCLYFLLDVTQTDLFTRGNEFTHIEGDHTHHFYWLNFEDLKEIYFYPEFLKWQQHHFQVCLEILSDTDHNFWDDF
ncbi:NUDIX hydrolase [Enterococcus cecorum]|uniref:NUDIX hydrolase n=3 Tax=Enterococcus cecorum TaxID=44008 RepID=UPI001FAD9A4C|nr:NUDIX domain-containing protein [Enterococcus cecorum]MCJ0606442.1 NUDIX domain-containing protein [Enterococcus cecorum]